MNFSDEIVINLSPNQQEEVIEKCGFNPLAINTSVLSLIKFSMAASAAESKSLPIVKNISSAALILNKTAQTTLADEPYFIDLDLTAQQRDILKPILKKDWLQMSFLPDEHEVSFSENWEQKVSIKHIGQSIKVIPQGIEYVAEESEKTIILPYRGTEKSQAFGKGSHFATQAVLILMEKYLEPDLSVADVGTGTGILAVAAARLKAKNIFACDVSAEAVLTAEKTIRLNNLERQIKIVQGSLDATKNTYDFVLANIFPKVIIDLADQFTEKVKEGGFLIVSGIVKPRMPGIIATLEKANFVKKDTVEIGNWSAAILRKQAAKIVDFNGQRR